MIRNSILNNVIKFFFNYKNRYKSIVYKYKKFKKKNILIRFCINTNKFKLFP